MTSTWSWCLRMKCRHSQPDFLERISHRLVLAAAGEGCLLNMNRDLHYFHHDHGPLPSKSRGRRHQQWRERGCQRWEWRGSNCQSSPPASDRHAWILEKDQKQLIKMKRRTTSVLPAEAPPRWTGWARSRRWGRCPWPGRGWRRWCSPPSWWWSVASWRFLTRSCLDDCPPWLPVAYWDD